MGYRSQVRCLIYGTKEALEAYMTEQALVFNSGVFAHFRDSLTRYTSKIKLRILDDNLNIKESHTEIHVLDLYGDSWKWYETYPGVQAWENFMTNSEEAGLAWEFIRIGEESDDIESRSGGDAQYLITSNTIIEDCFEKGTEIPLIF